MPSGRSGLMKYKSNDEYQVKVLALMVRDPKFIEIYYDVLNPDYFTVDTLGILGRLIMGYYDKYKIAPTRTSLEDMVDEYNYKKRVIPEDRERLLNMVEYIFRCDTSEESYIKDKVVSFGRTVALKHALSEVIDLVEDPDEDNYNNVKDIIDHALMVGTPMRSDRFDFNAFIRDPHDYMSRLREFDPSYRVALPWTKLNNDLEGGLGAGQLGVIMGGPGMGKSIFLLNIAHAAVESQGLPTYYFAIGDLKPHDISIRYLCKLFNMTYTDIVKNPDPRTLQEKIDFHSRRHRPLEIVYFAPSTVTVSTLKSYITKTISIDNDMRPGLIIVDYADNLLPTRYEGQGTYLEMGSVYEKLIEMGNSFDCPLWTASQPRRWGLTEEVLDVENVGDSWKKIQHADAVITINQSRVERDKDPPVLRLYSAKTRRGVSKKSIQYTTDFSRMNITEISV